MILIVNCKRVISFLMAASSYSKPIVGFLARQISVIPVYRPEDSRLLGKGKIIMKSSTQIEGINTKFITETKGFSLGVNSLLIDQKHSVQVEKVESETSIKIKDNQKVLEILSKEVNPTHSFHYIPKTDNSTMFKTALAKLAEGGIIGIFPEGTSHDRTDFIKLKAGVALLILAALENKGLEKVKIIPVGLTYFHPEEFRSDVNIEFGTPFEIPKELGEEFKINRSGAIDKILKEIELHMKSVTVRAPSFKEYVGLSLARNLYIPKDVTLDPTKYSDLSKRFSVGYEKLKDQKETKKLKRRVIRYLEDLENSGLEDSEVKTYYYSYGFFMMKTIWSFILFHVFIVLSTPMIVITAPFLWIIKKKAEKEQIKALAKNPNKIQALDVVSSVKIANFLIVFPLVFLMWILFFYFSFNYFFSNYIKGKFSKSTICALASIIFVFYSYFTTLMVDCLFFYLKTMKTRFLFFCYPKLVYRLRDSRKKLEKEMIDFINNNFKEFGFITERILDPVNDEKKIKENKKTISKDKKERKINDELQKFLKKFNLN